MIIYLQNQSILDSDSQVITNPVNCVGVMGAGLALEFKNRYPKMFRDYVKLCERKEVKPGVPYLWTNGDVMILNFPTKDNWRNASRVEWIESGILWIRDNYRILNIRTLAIPAVGCGLGGLDWYVVKSIIEKHLGDLDDLTVTAYPPQERKNT